MTLTRRMVYGLRPSSPKRMALLSVVFSTVFNTRNPEDMAKEEETISSEGPIDLYEGILTTPPALVVYGSNLGKAYYLQQPEQIIGTGKRRSANWWRQPTADSTKPKKPAATEPAPVYSLKDYARPDKPHAGPTVYKTIEKKSQSLYTS